jgi:hypothetical protein
MKPRKAAALGCGAALALLALAFGFLNYAMFGDHSYHATDVPRHEFAPASATSIEVYEARNLSGVVSLTYVVGEDEFRKFAAEKGWPLQTSSGAITVHLPSDPYTKSRKLTHLERFLHYERRQSNGGGITVTYIPSESRAYIDKSNR